jgi:hypothetical protein
MDAPRAIIACARDAGVSSMSKRELSDFFFWTELHGTHLDRLLSEAQGQRSRLEFLRAGARSHGIAIGTADRLRKEIDHRWTKGHSPSLKNLLLLSSITELSIDDLLANASCTCRLHFLSWYIVGITLDFIEKTRNHAKPAIASGDLERQVAIGKEVAQSARTFAAAQGALHLHNCHLEGFNLNDAIEDVGRWIEAGTRSAELAAKGTQLCYIACCRGTFGGPEDRSGALEPMSLTLPKDFHAGPPLKEFRISKGDYFFSPVFEEVRVAWGEIEHAYRTYMIHDVFTRRFAIPATTSLSPNLQEVPTANSRPQKQRPKKARTDKAAVSGGMDRSE